MLIKYVVASVDEVFQAQSLNGSMFNKPRCSNFQLEANGSPSEEIKEVKKKTLNKVVYHKKPKRNILLKDDILHELQNKSFGVPISPSSSMNSQSEKSSNSSCNSNSECDSNIALQIGVKSSKTDLNIAEVKEREKESEEQIMKSSSCIVFGRTEPFYESKLEKRRKKERELNVLIEKSRELSKEVWEDFNIIKNIRAIPSREITKRKFSIKFPEGRATKKTLILDMDETLIHKFSSPHELAKVPESKIITLQNANGDIYIQMVIRPFAEQLLKEMSPLCEIVIFTASEKFYADMILNYLDPERKYIHHRVYRSKCIRSNSHSIKDLRVFGNRTMKDMVIIDNSIISFCLQMDNGIHIPSFYGDPLDRELESLIPYLKHLIQENDMRYNINSTFLLPQLFKFHSQNPI